MVVVAIDRRRESLGKANDENNTILLPPIRILTILDLATATMPTIATIVAPKRRNTQVLRRRKRKSAAEAIASLRVGIIIPPRRVAIIIAIVIVNKMLILLPTLRIIKGRNK